MAARGCSRATSRSCRKAVKIEFPFTAEQVVLMGRTPHCDGLFESPEDWDAVERAMETTDTLAVPQPRLPVAERRRAAARGAGLGDGPVAAHAAARRADHVPRPQASARDLRPAARSDAARHCWCRGDSRPEPGGRVRGSRRAAERGPRCGRRRAAEVLRRSASARYSASASEVTCGRAGRPWIIYGA